MKQFNDQRPKKLYKYIDKTKVDEILERAREKNLRDFLVINTLWQTGMRCEELTNLKKRDIGKDQLMIRLGKGNKDRIIPAFTSLLDLLTLHTSEKNLEDYVFPNKQNNKISTTSIRGIVHKYQGNESIHPHTFRHSFAVFALKSGMNIRALQKILGHSNLATTAIYLDLIAQDIKDELKKLQF